MGREEGRQSSDQGHREDKRRGREDRLGDRNQENMINRDRGFIGHLKGPDDDDGERVTTG